MSFVHFLIHTPVVSVLLLLVLLITVVPIVTGRLKRRKAAHSDAVNAPLKEPPDSRFLGTQLDWAILILGLLLLAAIIGWVRKAFFG